MTLTETHAHLDFPDFASDLDAVVARARDAGVAQIVNVGTNLDSSRASRDLAERFECVVFTAGVHPHDAAAFDARSDETLAELRALAAHPKCAAIGEIGLDFFKDRSPRDVQERTFRRQLALARELGKPVVIHCRDAHPAAFAILHELAPASHGSRPSSHAPCGVMHCFSGGLTEAHAALDLGLLVSFTGVLTFPNAARAQAVARELPLESLMLETDCPFMAPVPHRGKRAEPAHVALIAKKLAELKGMTVEAVGEATSRNARRLFGTVLPG